jgi:hypothetical protein
MQELEITYAFFSLIAAAIITGKPNILSKSL